MRVSGQGVFLDDVVCPRHRRRLSRLGRDVLACPAGDEYPLVDGIPVLMVDDDTPTLPAVYEYALGVASGRHPQTQRLSDSGTDPVVQDLIRGTCGNLYKHLIGGVFEYPIPELRLPPATHDQRFLEVGCHWGRWCVSAARKGYDVVGIDPSLEGIQAARRVAAQLEVNAHFVVGDGRRLPFPDETFDVVFSYSVLQHFSRTDVRATLKEVHRVLRPSGRSLIQLANKWGVRSFYNRARAGFRDASDFDVRYWTPRELKETFEELIGPSVIEVDGFLSLNAQRTDMGLLRPGARAVVRTSEALRAAASVVPWLSTVADSLYVRSIRDEDR